MLERIRFVYDEPAMVIKADAARYLVVGDLHIGMERNLSARGIHVFNATDLMAERIKRIMKEFSLEKIVMLGDIKDSILYPDASTAMLIKGFFNALDQFEVIVVAGNHDAHLEEIVDRQIKRELILGKFALLHGDKLPSAEAMRSDYLITAHSHAIARIVDRNGAIYDQKAWLIAKPSMKVAGKAYDKVNKEIRLVVMPAFNSLIMGTEIAKLAGDIKSPLLRKGIFSLRGAEVYNLAGQRLSTTARKPKKMEWTRRAKGI